MFLKTLTVKGFKSFADATTLELQPGITVVVGPNGSGKSNIVDAVAWVLGAQGPRTLRSAKMDDVIFAGSADRPGLGRAEVTLTIDNSARLLPIDLPEVSFTRTLFRSGESEYALNGAACRLLDIQELLYDSGVGRQQHVIVSQGQLDAVLNSRPEDRRLLIEEAAGVLKYRKRRERAERRLEATEGNLLRLQDVLAELRRQARPLARQAEAARRHGGLVEEALALRRFLAGQELSALAARLETTARRNSELAAAEGAALAELARVNDRVAEGEAAASQDNVDDLSDAVARMSALRERARGLAALLAERHRSAERQLSGSGDEAMAAHLAQEAQRLRDGLESVEGESRELVERDQEAAEAESAVDEERSAFESEWAEVRTASSIASGEVRGELTALRRSVEEGRAGIVRLEARQEELRGRTATLDEELAAAEMDVASARRDRDSTEAELDSAHDRRVLAEERFRVQTDHADSVRRRAQAAAARSEALSQTLAEAAGEGDPPAPVEGALGRLRDLLDIDAGWEPAVYAALGEALSAVAVRDVDAARSLLSQLNEAGRSGAVVPLDAPLPPAESPPEAAQPGVETVRPRVRSGTPGVEPLLDVLLAGAVATDTWQAAIDAVLAQPGLVVVTRGGDRFGPAGWRASGGTRSMELALEEARREAAETAAALEDAEKELAAARSEREGSQDFLAAVERRMAEHEGRLREASAGLGRLRAERRQVEVELEALSSHLAHQGQRIADEEARAARLDSDLALLDAEEARRAERRAVREEAERHLADRASAARALRREVEVRAAALEERRELLARQLRDVESRIERLQGKEMIAVLQLRARATSRLAAMVGKRLVGIEEALASMQRRRRREQAARREASERLAVLRQERAQVDQGLEELRAKAREVQLEEAEVRVRIESLEESVVRDLGCPAEAVMAAEPPELPPGVEATDRLQELERQLRSMGPVNPLALEEHEALKERQRFLEEQLEDVRAGRRDLAKVIRSIDDEIIQVFSAAYADVAENFTKLFATLFPGGSGSLHLTHPDNLLETGVEVEARPAGKNVRRLSLLSGGERSLTALAFLFAVFRSRPSPFYLLDEVEAALDDVNLQRFLRLLDEFRQEAQLLVVTHQKRTMEAADCLYGVTMQPGGSSRVVSERVAAPAGR